MPAIPPNFRDQIIKITRSFIGAVLAGAGMAALNFFVAHVPDIINYLTMLGGAYIAHGNAK